MILHRYTVSALGHLADREEHDSSKLPRSALANAGKLLDSQASKFKAHLPLKGLTHIELRWESDDFSCALATFVVRDEMLTTDVILSGLRPDADQKLLRSAQAMVENVCTSAGEKAAEGIYRADKRPAVACVRWASQDQKGMDLVIDVELCLAAAFLNRAFETAKLVL